MLLAGMQFRIILTSIPLLGGAAWGAWHVIHDYQRQRILTFLIIVVSHTPNNPTRGATRHTSTKQTRRRYGATTDDEDD